MMRAITILAILASTLWAQAEKRKAAPSDSVHEHHAHESKLRAHLDRTSHALDEGRLDDARFLLEEQHHLDDPLHQDLAATAYQQNARLCGLLGNFTAAHAWLDRALAAGAQAHGAGSASEKALRAEIELVRKHYPQDAPFAPQDESLRMGQGQHTYTWVKNWGKLPEGMAFGNTHGGIVVDSKGQIYVNTDSTHAVIVFQSDGTYVRSFGEKLAGGLHGMVLAAEGEKQVLYAAHHTQHKVYKLTLEGEILMTLGWPSESKLYEKEAQYHPTSVAVAPDGTIFVADGYGLSYVHRYDAKGTYLGSFGGQGLEPGKFQTPHGLLIDTRNDPATLLVADRENHRLQWFDFTGKYLSLLDKELRRPCKVHLHGKDLVVADLAGRVTLFGNDGKLITHLGDQPDEKLRAQNGVPKTQWKDGFFISPHAAAFDADGNLYVMDWLALGRITKLARTK